MNPRFKLKKELANNRAFIEGEFKDYFPDDEVDVVYPDGSIREAIVTTRYSGGALVLFKD